MVAEIIDLFVSAEAVDLWGGEVGVLCVLVLSGNIAFEGFSAVGPVAS